MKFPPFPPNYERDAQRLKEAIVKWIEKESETRLVELRFHEWGRIAYIGPLCGEALEHLAASPDARAMLQWADEQSGRQGTLLMACAVLEMLGLKQAPPRPPSNAN